jgi:hypothetical protein
MTDIASGELKRGGRSTPEVASLSVLVGAHPDALRAIYEGGRAADPAELGDAPRGRVLALGGAASAFMALRPLLKAMATDVMPWKGKVFDHGGNSGQNVVLGRRVARFHAEVEPSLLDSRPSLLLRYSDPSYKNPRPLRSIVDELRVVGPGVAIGPALRVREGRPTDVLLWFGLERS